jgi:outer membrane protein OmpA-like peptidoglycan-associated protein
LGLFHFLVNQYITEIRKDISIGHIHLQTFIYRYIVIQSNEYYFTAVHSCRHLQAIGQKRGTHYPSGVYTINPGGQGNIKTYCDMTRNGGGWTLLVTSHTNSWTPLNVKRRAENVPRLDQDFSILFRANAIKNAINVRGESFEYRIEAHKFGKLSSSVFACVFG